uniref:Uncharacterized protein n=1 Tax=Helianthus annuus TaxID=4232 RepID=A0A251U910_HELAN
MSLGDLVSTKPRHGGQKNVNKFMNDIIFFVGRINYQSPRKRPDSQLKISRHWSVTKSPWL